ncbi:MAG TPA: shikimate kinase [Desulfobacteria bacterium]|nr:shikimate kinase [Desulfobacteria bacterium]
MNLVLTGFMGTGKTTVGRKLAGRLGMGFVDTDQDIEQVTEMTISEIFDKHGETRFRSEETAAAKRVGQKDKQVIATGGGIVLKQENMDILKENGIIICLSATPDAIYQRLKNSKNRPLLQTENPREKIMELLDERRPYYAKADAVVDTSGRAVDDIVNEIIRLYGEFSRK